jgi:hypothetical protein
MLPVKPLAATTTKHTSNRNVASQPAGHTPTQTKRKLFTSQSPGVSRPAAHGGRTPGTNATPLAGHRAAAGEPGPRRPSPDPATLTGGDGLTATLLALATAPRPLSESQKRVLQRLQEMTIDIIDTIDRTLALKPIPPANAPAPVALPSDKFFSVQKAQPLESGQPLNSRRSSIVSYNNMRTPVVGTPVAGAVEPMEQHAHEHRGFRSAPATTATGEPNPPSGDDDPTPLAGMSPAILRYNSVELGMSGSGPSPDQPLHHPHPQAPTTSNSTTAPKPVVESAAPRVFIAPPSLSGLTPSKSTRAQRTEQLDGQDEPAAPFHFVFKPSTKPEAERTAQTAADSAPAAEGETASAPGGSAANNTATTAAGSNKESRKNSKLEDLLRKLGDAVDSSPAAKEDNTAASEPQPLEASPSSTAASGSSGPENRGEEVHPQVATPRTEPPRVSQATPGRLSVEDTMRFRPRKSERGVPVKYLYLADGALDGSSGSGITSPSAGFAGILTPGKTPTKGQRHRASIKVLDYHFAEDEPLPATSPVDSSSNLASPSAVGQAS